MKAHNGRTRLLYSALLVMVLAGSPAQAVIIETFESFPVDTVLTTQIPGLVISTTTPGETPTVRIASFPVVPGEPMFLGLLPSWRGQIDIDFLIPTDVVGAIIDFGVVDGGVQLTAFEGLGCSGNIVGTDQTTSEVFISVTGGVIQSARFENLGDSDTWGMDNLTYNQIPEPCTLTLLALGGLGLLRRRRRKR